MAPEVKRITGVSVGAALAATVLFFTGTPGSVNGNIAVLPLALAVAVFLRTAATRQKRAADVHDKARGAGRVMPDASSLVNVSTVGTLPVASVIQSTTRAAWLR